MALARTPPSTPQPPTHPHPPQPPTHPHPLHQSAEGLRYDHILLAILDSNPSLSSSSRAALATAASLAGANGSKLSVCFIDQEGARVNGQRLEVVQGELARRELEVGGWGVGG